MTKPLFCLFGLVAALTLFSCKKSKNTPAPVIDSPVVYLDYMKLAPGNYWIYQDFELDSVNGAARALGTFDSVFVEKDTIINGNSYHKYWDIAFSATPSDPNYYQVSFLRDSLSYTIDQHGNIIFSYSDFTTVFKTTTWGPNYATPDTLIVTEQMGFKDSSITVDAGTFVTSSYRQIFHYPAADAHFGASREYDRRYSKNIGLISYTTGLYNSEPNVWERRLERYHLQ